MKRRSRLFLAGLILLGTIATGHDADAQGLPNVIEGFFPTQLAAGQGNVLHLGIPGRGEVTAVEINPAAGITVKDIKRGDVREGSLFWDVTIDVSAYRPGPRKPQRQGPIHVCDACGLGV